MYYRKENDPKFIELAIKKGYENVDWVLKKVGSSLLSMN